MKALSLWQPWASLWLSPRKVHETRHWRLKVPDGGFWLAVHAAKKPPVRQPETLLDEICDAEFGTDWPRTLPRGALIGRVFVTGCYGIGTGLFPADPSTDDIECGNWSYGRFCIPARRISPPDHADSMSRTAEPLHRARLARDAGIRLMPCDPVKLAKETR